MPSDKDIIDSVVSGGNTLKNAMKILGVTNYRVRKVLKNALSPEEFRALTTRRFIDLATHCIGCRKPLADEPCLKQGKGNKNKGNRQQRWIHKACYIEKHSKYKKYVMVPGSPSHVKKLAYMRARYARLKAQNTGA
jgi:hypothetical protein